VGGDQGAVFEDPNFVGEGVHFDDRFWVASGTL